VERGAEDVSAGTVSPNPSPRKAVATSSRPYAVVLSPSNAALVTSRAIATRLAVNPAR
jgi:hypothetical protein